MNNLYGVSGPPNPSEPEKLEVDGWKIQKNGFTGRWVLYHSHPDLGEVYGAYGLDNDGWIGVSKNLHNEFVCMGCTFEDLCEPPAALLMHVKIQKLSEPPAPVVEVSNYTYNPSCFYLAAKMSGTLANATFNAKLNPRTGY